MERLKAWLMLSRIENCGSVLQLRMVQELAEPQELFAHPALLEDVDWVPAEVKHHIAHPTEPEDWPRISVLFERYGIRYFTILDELYPPQLKTIFDPPLLLYYRGEFDPALTRRSLAVVGTRKASAYGISQTTRITTEVARAGFTIISGLAYGVDGAAHAAALDAGAPTMAVMGTGVDQIYPARHRALAERILDAGGVLLSEQYPGARAERWHFPTRNRIISGLTLGTLVIEGARKSGALLTSKFAMDQNRDLFALPGDVDRPQAEGPNYLISLGARIVTRAEDILQEYELSMHPATTVLPEMTAEEKELYELLLHYRPEIQYDLLLLKAGLSNGELSTLLLMLELKGLIRRNAGNTISALY